MAIYYLSPRWPSKANLFVSLDSNPAVKVDLTDVSDATGVNDEIFGASSASSIVWSATGLSNGPHQLSITHGDGLAIVDGFM